MKDVKIRKATIEDLKVILEMQSLMTAEERKFMKGLAKKGKMVSYLESEIKAILSSSKCYFTIAETQGKPIGCGFARIEKFHGDWSKYRKYGYLGLLYIVKEHRRRGIATALQKERVRWLKSKGIKICVNKIFANNRPAITLQEKRGFKPYIVKMYKII